MRPFAFMAEQEPPTPPVDPPINIGQPEIDNPGVGVSGTVNCSTGAWDPAATSYTYQWVQNGSTPIGGATSSAYTVQVEDIGTALACFVTGHNAGGASDPVLSTSTDTILP